MITSTTLNKNELKNKSNLYLVQTSTKECSNYIAEM